MLRAFIALAAARAGEAYLYHGTYNGSDGLTRTACGLADCRRAVLFVHVGKACGGSVKYSLEGNNVTYAEVHLRQPRPEVLAAFDKVIVTARDPIDRLISAFNWRHPGHNSGVLRYGEDEGKLYKCFPDVQAFARAVTSKHDPQHVSPACYLLAKAFLTNAAHSDTSHIGRGLAYYLGPILHDLLEKKSVFVIRSEACDRDSDAAVRWAKGDKKFPVASHHAHTHAAADRLSDAGAAGENVTEATRALLRNAYPLTTEYQFLEVLLDRSVNYGKQKKHRRLQSSCPKVFVYDLPELWDYPVPLDRLKGVAADEIFGRPCDAGIAHERHTDQFRLALIVLWRLVRGTRCAARTLDAAAADLFFVPTWPAARGTGDWSRVCEKDVNLHLVSRLEHLSARTAHKHVFLIGKGHGAMTGKCDSWWRAGRKKPHLALLRRAMRFAYSPHVLGDAAKIAERPGRLLKTTYGPQTLDDDGVAARANLDPGADNRYGFPHLVSVPYPSSIHASEATGALPPPWAPAPGRHDAKLAIFVGKTHGASYGAVRERLAKECAASAACEVVDEFSHAGGGFCGLQNMSYPATFCLEPGGDSPYRKGFYDALLTGCVPVIFSLYNELVAPWFVPRNATVRFSEHDYLAGKFRVLDELRKIPSRDIVRKQRAIAAGAFKLQYALDELPGDAFETLMSGALELSATLGKVYAD